MNRQRALIGVLLWLLATLVLSGCGRIEAMAMIEERPTEIEDASGCSGSKSPRGWQYRSQLDMGEAPPSRSQAGKKSYIGRTRVTKELESGFSLRSGLLIGEIILLIVSLFLAMVAVGAAFNKETPSKRKMVLFAAALATGIAGVVLGYGAGSVVSLDNPTKTDVIVVMNGEKVTVPAGKFTDVRVAATTVNIIAEADGKPIEQLTMLLDDGIGETLFRSTLGDGRYIYSVCGKTKYHLSSARYE